MVSYFCYLCEFVDLGYMPIIQNAFVYLKKMKNIKYHSVGTISTSNRKIVERGKIDTLSTHIHDRSLFWLGTGI